MNRYFKLIIGLVVAGTAFSTLAGNCCITHFLPTTACHQYTPGTCFVKISKTAKTCACETTVGIVKSDIFKFEHDSIIRPLDFGGDHFVARQQLNDALLKYAHSSTHYPPQTIQNISPVHLQKSILRI